ncbi:MAG: ribose 5-phosphate isomerase B [Ignavibacteriales bacterium]|nr:ribose 5-phosphate isomerase B [Ignavibacteriales bacterium]
MIALGSDHAGFEYKEKIKTLLTSMNFKFHDFGTHSTTSCDYPDYAHAVATSVSKGDSKYGILVCGTGIGMAITANKHSGIRAANIESKEASIWARAHNNTNILCIGARLTEWEIVAEIVNFFLSTAFEGGRHKIRVKKIHSLTNL